MTIDDADDPTWRRLRRLPVVAPDAARTARVRSRCRAVLARRHKHAERSTRRRSFRTVVIEATLLGAFTAMYLVAIIHDLLRLQALR
jgi:hypothetical protein